MPLNVGVARPCYGAAKNKWAKKCTPIYPDSMLMPFLLIALAWVVTDVASVLLDWREP